MHRYLDAALTLRQVVILGKTQTINCEQDALDFCKKNHLNLAYYNSEPDANLDKVVSLIEESRQAKNLRLAISEIWISSSIYKTKNALDLEAVFSDSAVNLVYLPELPIGFDPTGDSISLSNGLLYINSRLNKNRKRNLLLKILKDKIIAITTLTLLSPLLLLISALIKAESRGPILFRQNRYGIDGKEFKVLKFRTMTCTESDDEFLQATFNDSRITKVGAFLRKSSLDELPQLINVITGDMSIVGPRPHPVNLNEQYRSKVPNYMRRHTMRPGITGLAQINGYRGELLSDEDMQNRIKLDLEYIYNWSIPFDFKIIFLTFYSCVYHRQSILNRIEKQAYLKSGIVLFICLAIFRATRLHILVA